LPRLRCYVSGAFDLRCRFHVTLRSRLVTRSGARFPFTLRRDRYRSRLPHTVRFIIYGCDLFFRCVAFVRLRAVTLPPRLPRFTLRCYRCLHVSRSYAIYALFVTFTFTFTPAPRYTLPHRCIRFTVDVAFIAVLHCVPSFPDLRSTLRYLPVTFSTPHYLHVLHVYTLHTHTAFATRLLLPHHVSLPVHACLHGCPPVAVTPGLDHVHRTPRVRSSRARSPPHGTPRGCTSHTHTLRSRSRFPRHYRTCRFTSGSAAVHVFVPAVTPVYAPSRSLHTVYSFTLPVTLLDFTRAFTPPRSCVCRSDPRSTFTSFTFRCVHRFRSLPCYGSLRLPPHHLVWTLAFPAHGFHVCTPRAPSFTSRSF